MQTVFKLFQYIRNYKPYIALNVVSNILMVFFNLVSIPMLIPFLQILLGQAIPPTQKPDFQWNIKGLTESFYFQLGQIIEQYGKERALIYVCGTMVFLFFFKNLFRYLALYFIAPLRTGVVRDIRQAVFDKTLRLPLSYFNNERKGDLMSRVTADVQEVEWSILNVLETVVREPLLIIGSMAIMIHISPALTGFVLVLLGFTALIIGGIGKSLKKESSVLQGQFGTLVSVLDEALGGARVIKAFNAETYQRQKFNMENTAYRQLLMNQLRKRELASPTTEFLGIAVHGDAAVGRRGRIAPFGCEPTAPASPSEHGESNSVPAGERWCREPRGYRERRRRSTSGRHDPSYPLSMRRPVPARRRA